MRKIIGLMVAALGLAGSVSAQDYNNYVCTTRSGTTCTAWSPLDACVEDVAATAAANMVGVGSVRRDTAASSAGTDGDNATINTDSLGRLWVTASAVEDAAETAGGIISMCGTVRRDTAATSAGTDGDNATLNTDSLGRLWVSGSAVEDAAETAGGVLGMVGSVRRDTKASSAGTTGDNATLNTDANGGLWLAADVVEDVAETAAAPLVGVGTVRRDTLASSAGTDGDNATLNTNASGALYVINTGAAAITCTQTDVPSTGTAVQLGSATCKYVLVSCEGGNTSNCYVRGSAGNGVTGGMEIAKGTAAVRFDVNNSNLLFVDAGTNGDDVGSCCIN